jgi:hypothetical protein
MSDFFELLETFLIRIPGIKAGIGKGQTEDGLWWVKFQIDIQHPLAWKFALDYRTWIGQISKLVLEDLNSS